MPTLATPQVRPLTAWSFSRYSDYKTCPQLFKFKHLMGMKEPGNAAMQRGSDIHTLAESYTKGQTPKLPTELGLFKEEFADLKKQKYKYIEESWIWTKDWAAETVFNDWKGAWLRVKLDAAYLNPKHNALVVIDHKTGKLNDYRKPEYHEQLELYGLSGLIKFPEVKLVSPRLWYLDAGVIYPDGVKPDEPELEYTRADEPRLRKVWLARIKPMFSDTKCKPKPSKACDWCHFRKANGGPCVY